MVSHLDTRQPRAMGFPRKVATERAAPFGLALAATSVLLAACITPPITATPTGTGAVAIAWDGTADGVGPPRDLLVLCSATDNACAPGNALFDYAPADGTTSATLVPGMTVRDSAGHDASLPAGAYSLQAYSDTDNASGTQFGPVGSLLQISLGSRDLTIWWQSVGRESDTAPCPSGWKPSWARWPSEGAGGYVCNKQVYAYYPDEPVIEPGAELAGTPWLLSIGRDSAEESCPDGYNPSWAQWPSDGDGGYVCNKLSD